MPLNGENHGSQSVVGHYPVPRVPVPPCTLHHFNHTSGSGQEGWGVQSCLGGPLAPRKTSAACRRGDRCL